MKFASKTSEVAKKIMFRTGNHYKTTISAFLKNTTIECSASRIRTLIHCFLSFCDLSTMNAHVHGHSPSTIRYCLLLLLETGASWVSSESPKVSSGCPELPLECSSGPMCAQKLFLECSSGLMCAQNWCMRRQKCVQSRQKRVLGAHNDVSIPRQT